MDEYQTLVESALCSGHHKPNRTGVDTISVNSQSYTIDLSDGYPLLTTKQMDGYRWNSLIHEFCWYLSGEEHIKNLREETKIWDAWADEEGRLDTAYGRFWRRYPIPEAGVQHLPGETWAGHTETRWDDSDDIDPERWVNHEETDDGQTRKTFDQIQYVLDMLHEQPYSRRLAVTAWHPANATVSTLPPCHFTFVFNVQGDGTLNVHLFQRSGDIALGVPFNIAAYSLLAKAVAQRTEFEIGEFGHTIVDAHIYCGDDERGDWYADNLHALQEQLNEVSVDGTWASYTDVAEWIEDEAPAEAEGSENLDHVPGLLRQLDRDPLERPAIDIADKPLDDLAYEDIQLRDYKSHDGITFGVAE